MTDHPILFSPPMIRAILREIDAPGAGKTQTRRVLKLPTKTASGGPIYERADMGGWEPTTHGGGKCFTFGRDGSRLPVPEMVGMWHRTTGVGIVTPHQVGDRLWCRETWGGYRGAPNAEEFAGGVPIFYRADPDDAAAGIDAWRPSIHMPRWSSRLTLYVTQVRVERLQEISEADARAEGVECDSDGWRDYLMPQTQCCATANDSFRTLWDSINGPGAWDLNSWVSVTVFRPVLGNVDGLPDTLQEAV